MPVSTECAAALLSFRYPSILVRYIKACCYWLKSLGIHCLHYAQCLFLFETNSKIKHVPNYSHRYRAEEKKKQA